MAKPGGPEYTERKKIPLGTVQVDEGDLKLLGYIQEYLGCSKAEAIRSSIRAMATQLALIDKRKT